MHSFLASTLLPCYMQPVLENLVILSKNYTTTILSVFNIFGSLSPAI